MFLRPLGTCVVLAASGLLCFGADTQRPACNAQTSGRMWPEAANRDHKIVSKLARCGDLLICTRGVWRYHWEPLTVRVDQLRHGSKSKRPAGCEVTAEVPPDGVASSGN